MVRLLYSVVMGTIAPCMQRIDNMTPDSAHFSLPTSKIKSCAMIANPNIAGKVTKQVKRIIFLNTFLYRPVSSLTWANVGCATPVTIPLMVLDAMSSHFLAWVYIPATCSVNFLFSKTENASLLKILKTLVINSLLLKPNICQAGAKVVENEERRVENLLPPEFWIFGSVGLHLEKYHVIVCTTATKLTAWMTSPQYLKSFHAKVTPMAPDIRMPQMLQMLVSFTIRCPYR